MYSNLIIINLFVLSLLINCGDIKERVQAIEVELTNINEYSIYRDEYQSIKNKFINTEENKLAIKKNIRNKKNQLEILNNKIQTSKNQLYNLVNNNPKLNRRYVDDSNLNLAGDIIDEAPGIFKAFAAHPVMWFLPSKKKGHYENIHENNMYINQKNQLKNDLEHYQCSKNKLNKQIIKYKNDLKKLKNKSFEIDNQLDNYKWQLHSEIREKRCKRKKTIVLISMGGIILISGIIIFVLYLNGIFDNYQSDYDGQDNNSLAPSIIPSIFDTKKPSSSPVFYPTVQPSIYNYSYFNTSIANFTTSSQNTSFFNTSLYPTFSPSLSPTSSPTYSPTNQPACTPFQQFLNTTNTTYGFFNISTSFINVNLTNNTNNTYNICDEKIYHTNFSTTE